MNELDRMIGVIGSFTVKAGKDNTCTVTLTLAVPATPKALALAGEVGVAVEAYIKPLQAKMGMLPTDMRTGEMPPDQPAELQQFEAGPPEGGD